MRQKGANVADNCNKPTATSECSRNKLNLLFVNILNNTCNWDFPAYSTKIKSSSSQNPKPSVGQLSADRLRRCYAQATDRPDYFQGRKFTMEWNSAINPINKTICDIHNGCSAENDRIQLRIYS